MDTTIHAHTVTPALQSWEALATLAEKQGWKKEYAILGNHPMIVEPMDLNGWRYFVAEDFVKYTNKSIPPEALKRMFIVANSGISVKGWIIGEDIEVLESPVAKPKWEPPKIDIDTGAVLATTGTIAVTVGAAALFAMGAIAYALFTLLSFDPVLICVTEDETWHALHWWVD